MPVTEEQIRAAAEATLKRWPAASAVLLFGSRARGDHLPSSDWDLAVVTDDPLNRPRDLPLLDLAELHHPEMDVAFISDDDIHRHRNLLGRLGCSLARDARPIAGNWNPPPGLKEPEMDCEMYHDQVSNSLLCIAATLRSALHARRSSTAAAGQRAANSFVNRSAVAAEHLAKAMLVRNGHQPRSIHDLTRLADGIAAESPELAERIRSLKGHTLTDHTAHCSDSPPATAESVRHAVRRLTRTQQLLTAALAHWRTGAARNTIPRCRNARTSPSTSGMRGQHRWTTPNQHRDGRRWPCAAGVPMYCGALTSCGRHGGRRSRNRQGRQSGMTVIRPCRSDSSEGSSPPGSLAAIPGHRIPDEPLG